MTLWGHGILRDEGIGGPTRPPGAGFMMRNFLVEALMLLGESSGLELEEPVFESVAGAVVGAARASRVRRRAGHDLWPRPAGHGERPGRRPPGLGLARPVRLAERDGMEARPVSSWRATRLSRRSFAATCSSTRIRRPARGRWPRSAAPGSAAWLHTIDELGLRPVFM